MGQALAILINGRDRGFQLEAPWCKKCEQPMEFERYRGWSIYGLEGGMRLERAYYVCERYPPAVRQVPGYFRANQTRMRYDYFRETGYPIGSGTVESAANNVTHHRMRRPGRGWLA